MSPFHFQRMFTDWAGVSPKKFLQFLTVEHAKKLLKEDQASLFDTAIETGLSGTGRLHDLFVNIEGMTPGEYKNGGESLAINYSFAESPFGNMLVASTSKGICHMAFADNEKEALAQLKAKFPNATYRQVVDLMQQNVLYIFTHDWSKLSEVKLHLKGNRIPIKSLGNSFKDPHGQIDNLWKHCKTYSTTQSIPRSRYSSRRQPRCFFDTLPSNHPIHRCIWRISLGFCSKNCNHRMGSGKDGEESIMIAHSELTKDELRAKIRNGTIRFAGNLKLKIYGRLDCNSGKRMKKENRIFFRSLAEAVQLGFRPCGHCMNKEYGEWKMGNG